MPSIGVAYGLSEVESRSQLISRRQVAFLTRLNQEKMGSPLIAEARISRIVTLSSEAAMKSMPEKTDIRIIENTDLKPRAWMDNGTAVVVGQDTPGLLTCTTTGPGRLIWSESFFPGWTATCDGKRVPVQAFDETFLSVEIPAGAHNVRFHYRPISFYVGMTISAMTLLLIGLV